MATRRRQTQPHFKITVACRGGLHRLAAPVAVHASTGPGKGPVASGAPGPETDLETACSAEATARDRLAANPVGRVRWWPRTCLEDVYPVSARSGTKTLQTGPAVPVSLWILIAWEAPALPPDTCKGSFCEVEIANSIRAASAGWVRGSISRAG